MKASQAQELYRESAERIKKYSLENRQGALELTSPNFKGGVLLSYQSGASGRGRISSAMLYGLDLGGFLPNVYVYGALPAGTVTCSGETGRGEYAFSLSLPDEKSALLMAGPESISIIENGNPRDLEEILPAFLETLSKGGANLRKE